jgi:tetratricopeptide (TPR) repeat protein
MQILVKTVFVFLFIFFFTSQLYSFCYEKEKAFKNYVVKSDFYVKHERMDEAEEALKKYLKCYPEKEVFVKLAKLYESQKKYYLAGLTYKTAGLENEYSEVEKRRLSKLTPTTFHNFNSRTNTKIREFKKTGDGLKGGAIALFSIGSALAAAGGGIFISNKAFEGKTSELIQYSLLIGGFSIIGAGFSTNFNGDHYTNKSISLEKFNTREIVDHGTTMEEYFVHTGAQNNAKKMSAKSLKIAGISMLAVSVPILTFSMFSLFDDYRNIFKYTKEDDSERLGELLFSYIAKGVFMPPALLFMIRGIVMLAKASKWEKLNTEPSILTLNSIAPIIDPVSKTYGLALGFSF